MVSTETAGLPDEAHVDHGLIRRRLLEIGFRGLAARHDAEKTVVAVLRDQVREVPRLLVDADSASHRRLRKVREERLVDEVRDGLRARGLEHVGGLDHVLGDEAQSGAVGEEDLGVVGVAKPRGRFGDGVQVRVDARWTRAAGAPSEGGSTLRAEGGTGAGVLPAPGTAHRILQRVRASGSAARAVDRQVEEERKPRWPGWSSRPGREWKDPFRAAIDAHKQNLAPPGTSLRTSGY